MLNSLVHSKDPNPLIFMVNTSLTNKNVDKILSQPSDGYRAAVTWYLSVRATASKSTNSRLSNFSSRIPVTA